MSAAKVSLIRSQLQQFAALATDKKFGELRCSLSALDRELGHVREKMSVENFKGLTVTQEIILEQAARLVEACENTVDVAYNMLEVASVAYHANSPSPTIES